MAFSISTIRKEKVKITMLKIGTYINVTRLVGQYKPREFPIEYGY